MKRNLILLIILVFIFAAGVIIGPKIFKTAKVKTNPTITKSIRFVKSTITVDGTVTAQSQATLSFQTAGKLTYLPFKEGDKVNAGQTIARLDTYQLQRLLSATLNNYRSTRDTFDQTQSNAQKDVLQGAQQYSLQVTNRGAFEPTDVIGDIVKRILDQNQVTLDNSVINVELANYAIQLATLTSPISGVITRQGATVSGVNITPATSFTVADPESMVFRANIPIENIYYIEEGSTVTLAIDGINERIVGTVVKIYPAKVTFANGSAVYQADIASDELLTLGKLDQSGTAIISTNSENVGLVPVWTVLNGKYIWVDEGGTAKLKEIKSSKIHGNEIEITEGLTGEDKIIIDPEIITSGKYSIL